MPRAFPTVTAARSGATKVTQHPVSAHLEGSLTRATTLVGTLIPAASMVRVRMFVVRCALVALALVVGACTTNWAWQPLNYPTPIEPDNLVWVWSRGTINKWRAVVFTHDSVSGIPYDLALKCDSCRLSLPLTQVDSMRLGYRYESTPKVVLEDLAFLGAVFGLAILIAAGLTRAT